MLCYVMLVWLTDTPTDTAKSSKCGIQFFGNLDQISRHNNSLFQGSSQVKVSALEELLKEKVSEIVSNTSLQERRLY